MAPEPILLFGANGQLGAALCQVLGVAGKLIPLTREDADFRDADTLRDIVRRHRPGCVVNAVAYTAVDKAESDIETARAVNEVAPGILAEEAEALGAVMVHYSTDYVFDGRKPGAYLEDDEPHPQSVYGKTKLGGELAVARACRRHLIFRTSWVFGEHGGNFLKTMLRLAAERDSLRIVSDQVGAPTSADLIARTSMAALFAMTAADESDERWGLYHLVAAGETNWYEYARYVIGRTKAAGIGLRCGPEAVVPISSTEYPTPAVRPANSRLDTGKLRSRFGVSLPDWKTGVDSVLTSILANQGQNKNESE